MRIALVSQEYPPETAHGGIATQTHLKAHGLAALGHEIYVISHSADEASHEYDDGKVHVVRIPSLDRRLEICTQAVRWLTYSTEVAVAVADLHARLSLDLVDFPEWGGEGYVHLLNRAEWNRLRSVIQLHGPLVMLANTIGWPKLDSEFYRVGSAMEHTCLRLADAVFSSSKCAADWCRSHYGLEQRAIPVLHAGVDTGLFRPQSVPKSDRPTIVFVGRVSPSKGVEDLVDAAMRVASRLRDLRLRLIGSGDESFMAILREKARASGCPDLLELTGFVQATSLPDELSRAHLFAAPSHYEGGPGFVYLEAMACGLPVVATTGSGIEEIVRSGENGVLVAPGDVHELTQVLERLLVNADQREAMGEAARHFVQSEADTRVCLQRLEAFYSDVLSGPGRGPN